MNTQDQRSVLLKQLGKSIEGREAHIDFEAAIADFPEKLRGIRPKGGPHSAWELLEHMRIAQRDILEFSRDAAYKSPAWPEGYWPSEAAPPDADAWNNSVKSFLTDRREFEKLIKDKNADLFQPLEHGDGQNLLREALLIASHNSYHLGQLVYVKRLLTKTD